MELDALDRVENEGGLVEDWHALRVRNELNDIFNDEEFS